ncbi:MAG: hypothetical protein Sylvanvirus39_3 [Sylvanvirus sp.]|uniref:Uncharacterized protein n=1 Tax=Sylvanvirus sp. TaxID=2487774 RepID=A0A3G5AJ72_9VIRU|nr:MAG: hypothetical protein Sylvanvirus39_3 [Sylvanvirus sp.]
MSLALAAALLPWETILTSAPVLVYVATRMGHVAESATSIILRVTGYSGQAGDCLSECENAQWMISAAEVGNLELKDTSSTTSIQASPKTVNPHAPSFSPPPLVSSADPLLQELQQNDFFVQLGTTRALLYDLYTILHKASITPQHPSRILSTPLQQLPSQLLSIDVSMTALEQVLQRIQSIVIQMEQERAIHKSKWFYAWRTSQLTPLIQQLTDLAPLLERRTLTLMHLYKFWCTVLK